MPREPTPPDLIARINAMTNAVSPLLISLYVRWQDERDYEDIDEYAVPIRKHLPEGFSLSQMHRRPFGFSFVCVGFDAEYQFSVTARSIGWKRKT
jgi:hypothetical protein